MFGPVFHYGQSLYIFVQLANTIPMTNGELITTGGPTFDFELQLLDKFGGPIAGIDEAGRGPWAGPVVAAAVILDPDDIPHGLNDSKKLSESQRERLFHEITSRAQVGVGIGPVSRIDNDNILRATLWSMAEALKALKVDLGGALVDGNKKPDLACPCECVVKGDGRSLSIAAASIIAKVTRDRIMCDLAKTYPEYGWERNKGYGTTEHRAALATHGVSDHHRRSFKPIMQLLKQCKPL